MNQKKKRSPRKAFLHAEYNPETRPLLKKKMRKRGYSTVAKGTRAAVEEMFDLKITNHESHPQDN